MQKDLITSYSYDEQEILKNILKLHCKTNIELDPTYSKGNFYKRDIMKPFYKFDISPQHSDIIAANAEELPLKNESITTMIFDPPFLATTGKSLTQKNKSNVINKRFSVYPNEKALHQFYVKALVEFYRILKEKGILIFKCQDKVSGGKQYFSHNFIINAAEEIGFYTKDLFILLAKNRIVADWQRKNQKHCRKFHCYFLVFEKSKRKVVYI